MSSYICLILGSNCLTFGSFWMIPLFIWKYLLCVIWVFWRKVKLEPLVGAGRLEGFIFLSSSVEREICWWAACVQMVSAHLQVILMGLARLRITSKINIVLSDHSSFFSPCLQLKSGLTYWLTALKVTEHTQCSLFWLSFMYTLEHQMWFWVLKQMNYFFLLVSEHHWC